MKFSAALGLAGLVHGSAALVLALAWPRAANVAVEVVPSVELRPSLAGGGGETAAPPAGGPAPRAPRTPHPVTRTAPSTAISAAARTPTDTTDPKVAARTAEVEGGAILATPATGRVGTSFGDGRDSTSVAEAGASVGGAGSGAHSGTGGLGGADRGALIAETRARIRSHRRYPELSRRRGIEGVVGLAFRVQPDGRVTDLIVRRSADPALDEAAREAVLAAMPLPPLGEVEIDLDFVLHER